MRVRCLMKRSTTELATRLGEGYIEQGHAVSPGREYVVLGMAFTIGEKIWGTGCWISYEDDDGQYAHAPLGMFEIVDSMVSRYWRVFDRGDGTAALYPPEIADDHFMEDLYEGEPKVVAAYQTVRDRLVSEDESTR